MSKSKKPTAKAADTTAAQPATSVFPFARVVASGFDAKANKIKATILLTPWPNGESVEDVPFKLESWPSDVIEKIRGDGWKITFGIAEVKRTGQEISIGAPRPIEAEATAIKDTWPKGPPADLQNIWARCFIGNNGSLWGKLSNVLSASLAGKSYAIGDLKETTEHTTVVPKMGERGEINVRVEHETDKENRLESVVAVGHGELALALGFKRVREFCDALVDASDDTQRRRIARETEACQAVFEARKEEFKDLQSTDEEESGSYIDAQIVKEKEKEYSSLDNDLKNVRDNARAIFNVAKRELESSACVETTPVNVSGSRKPSDIAKEVGEGKNPASDSSTRVALASHAIGTWPQYSRGGQQLNKIDEDSQIASQTYFSLQSSPSLSRLFGLAIDVTLDAKDLPSGADDGRSHFYHLDLSFGNAAKPQGWRETKTLAKFIGREGKPPHFWPASKAELHLPEACAPSASNVTQFDGRLVLGAGCAADSCSDHAPRFDVTSMDIRMVTEMERQREANRLADLADHVIRTGGKECKCKEVTEPPALSTIPTAGLTIIDRGRLAATVRQLASRDVKASSADGEPIVLDAEDVTVGYRLDVGIPTQEKYRWSSLMNRYVEFGGTGMSSDLIKRALNRLIGPAKGARRVSLEGAMISLPGRYMPKPSTKDEATTSHVEAFVEETVVYWDGSPMAVECSGSKESKRVSSGLPFGTTYSLPEGVEDASLCPPALRYGWPYRFGMRAVYLGGGSVDVEEGDGYGSLGGQLAFPPGIEETAKEHVRFLRHHRVDAPYLLLPKAVATRSNGPLAVDRATLAVVRTIDPASRDLQLQLGEAGTRITAQRIIVPPSLSLADVARHGTFDKDKTEHPIGELTGVDHSAVKGGFPCVTAPIQTGIDGRRFVGTRSVTSDDAKQTDTSFRGDLVFRKVTGTRPLPYYTDPCAETYVIALRDPQTGLFVGKNGTSVKLAIRNKDGLGSVLPLLVTVAAKSGSRPKGATALADYVKTANQANINPDGKEGALQNGGSVLAQQVTIDLYAGEEFDVLVWCAPTGDTLAKKFDLVQSLATVAANCTGDNGAINTTAIANLEKLIGQSLAKRVAKAAEGVDGKKVGYCGPGGMRSPDGRVLTAIGEMIAEVMASRPVNEIAGVRSFRAVHAVNKPLSTPSIALQGLDTQEEELLQVFRPGSERFQSQNLTPDANAQLVCTVGDAPPPPAIRDELKRIEDGASDFVLSGKIEVDVATSEAISVVAAVTLPRSRQFDNPKRGRSSFSRRAGLWRGEIKKLEAKDYRDIFGFEVNSDGIVTLPKSNVELLRIEGLHGLPSTIDLMQFYGAASAPSRRISHPHAFPDGKARSLQLKVIARSRTSQYFDSVDRLDSSGRQMVGEQLEEKDATVESNAETVVLPATFRSAKCNARTPVPGFIWTRSDPFASGDAKTYTVTRETYLHIPLAREWFSNGEFEKLGVVVWPPALGPDGAGIVGTSSVSIKSPYSDERVIDLPNFEDEQLGPGGRFITRWGADPIRLTQQESGPLIPFNSFADLDEPVPGQPKPVRVNNVMMPVTDGDAGNGKEEKVSSFMQVGLIAYEPRFDVDKEEWFVDFKLTAGQMAEPFVRLGLVRYQPHTREDLQLSFPVVQWAQLLPKRTASITVVNGEQRRIQVRVYGPGKTGELPHSFGLPVTNRKDGQPLVRVALVHEYQTEAGPMREWLESTDVELANDEHSGVVWKYDLTMPSQDKLTAAAARAGSRFVVFVQEIDRRRPATYDSEPVPLSGVHFSDEERALAQSQSATNEALLARDDLVISGPRFSAWIAVDLQPQAKSMAAVASPCAKSVVQTPQSASH